MEVLVGRVPTTLRGRLYRLGPGRFSRQTLVAHPLDGDGRVDSLEFPGDGSIRVTSRFVETRYYVEEEAAGRALYNGVFGTKPPTLNWSGHPLVFKNPANTSVLLHAGALLALWEGGAPHQLHPTTLETLPLSPSLGVLAVSEAPPFSTGIPGADALLGIGGAGVGAHSVTDPATGRRAVMLTTVLPFQTRVRICELEAHSFDTHCAREVLVPGYTHVHSFGMTQKAYVFVAAAMRLDAASVALGMKAPALAVEHADEPSTLFYVPRNPALPEVRARIERVFVTHVVNAHEAPGGHVVFDFIGCPTLSLTRAPRVTLRRLVLHRTSGTVVSCVEVLPELCEFPAIAAAVQTLEHRHVYAIGSSTPDTPFDSYIKVDMQTGETLRFVTRNQLTKRYGACYHLEPVVAGETHLLGWSLSEKGCLLTIVDARTMVCLAVVRMPDVNPFGLHAEWVPA
jgi:all-trans-8'-apo-beta-carotenal 15,15'-oxygenase